MTEKEVVEILERDIVIYTASLHWNVCRSAYHNQQPKVIYVQEFIELVARKIFATFDPSILTKKSVMHLAHWYIEGMIREQYSNLVNKPD